MTEPLHSVAKTSLGKPSATIRVLAVDDHPLLREGIAALLTQQSDMTLIAEAESGREAVEKYRTSQPHITLMDLQMPHMSGIEAIVAIREEYPGARIIVLTTFGGDVLADRALKAGARAYVLKGMVRKDLLETIRAVNGGSRQISPEVAAQLACQTGGQRLSYREVEVLQLVAAGQSNKRIADRLEISLETAKSHVKNILNKLQAFDRTHAVAVGLKRGIIQF
jgi:DNA-binding NarL/FixJ family response regulator